MIFDIMVSETIWLDKQAFILHFCPNSFKYSFKCMTASHFSPCKSAITSMPQSYLSCYRLGWQTLSVIFSGANLRNYVQHHCMTARWLLIFFLLLAHYTNPIFNTKCQVSDIINVIPLHVPLSFDSGSIVKVWRS